MFHIVTSIPAYLSYSRTYSQYYILTMPNADKSYKTKTFKKVGTKEESVEACVKGS